MFLDIIVLILYFVSILYLSVLASKKKLSNKETLTGGDGFGLWTAAVGRTANMAGGPATMGNATYGYKLGFGGIWFAVANILSMWLSAPFARRIYKTMKLTDSFTIGGYIGNRFGSFSQIFAGGTNALAYLGFVASNILATGTVLHSMLDIDYIFAVVISAIITVLYTMSGGIKSVYAVNVIQVLIMVIGFFVILFPSSLNSVGGINEMVSSLPSEHTDLMNQGLFTVIWGIIIPTAVTGFTTQAGYISVFSSKDMQTSWKSTLLSGVIYSFIVFPIILTGIAGYLLFPGQDPSSILTFMISKLLPRGLIGFLVASIISATMSTAASCSLNAITCLKVDVLDVLFKDSKFHSKILNTRLLIVLINVIALVLALVFPSVIKLLLIGYSLASGGLLIPVFATMLWRRATKLGVILSMLCGGISFCLLEFNFISTDIPPLMLSLILSAFALIIGSYTTKPQSQEILENYFDRN
ncbi:sodium:solute symporter family protein [Aerococcus mictus]|uniref:sodium:solute symporter family protein n=1 Tax=Aerococcus mictus TaxID=2976810 RepID=UPI0015EB9956|nr:sodium:solute symporter family protein [Aerococcus mictus]MDL5183859.1 sodium:solute symporter family protein [Aerococcus mictus]